MSEADDKNYAKLKSAAFITLASIAVLWSFSVLLFDSRTDEVILDSNVYINSDPVESLIRLPGIGQALANRIIEYRESYDGEKAFNNEDDLKKVRGIGDARAQAILPYISFELSD